MSFTISFDLEALGDPPPGVRLLGQHLQRAGLRRAQEGGRTGDGEERADLELLRGAGGGGGHGEGEGG